MPLKRFCIKECPNVKHLFSFPDLDKDRERREEWARRLGVNDSNRIKHMYACEKHFSKLVLARRKLLREALPDLNLTPGCDGTPGFFIYEMESWKKSDGEHRISRREHSPPIKFPPIASQLPQSTTMKLISTRIETTPPPPRKLFTMLKQPKMIVPSESIPLPVPNFASSVLQATIPHKAQVAHNRMLRSPLDDTRLNVQSASVVHQYPPQIRYVYPVKCSQTAGDTLPKVTKPLATRPQILTILAPKQNNQDTPANLNEAIDYDDATANKSLIYPTKTRQLKVIKIPLKNIKKVPSVPQPRATATASPPMVLKRKSLAVFVRTAKGFKSSTTNSANDPLAIEKNCTDFLVDSSVLHCDIQYGSEVPTIIMQDGVAKITFNNGENRTHYTNDRLKTVSTTACNNEDNIGENNVDSAEDRHESASSDTDSYSDERNTASDDETQDLSHDDESEHTTYYDRSVQTAEIFPNSIQILNEITEMKRRLQDQADEIATLKATLQLMQRNSGVVNINGS